MKTKLLAAAVALVVLSAFAKIILYTDKPNAVPVNSDFFSLQRNSDYINASVAQVKGDWFNNPVFTGNGSINGDFTANNFFGNGSFLSGITASFGPTITNNTFINTNVAFINLETNNIFVNTNVAFINIETNNTFVNTNVTILSGSSNYINNVFETNVTIVFPGGATNLNLTPNSLMQSDVNDAESSVPNGTGILTNNGVGVFGWVAISGLGGNFVLANNGNGTNTTNWGVSSFQEIDAVNFFPTNLFTGLTNFSVLGTDSDGLLTLGSSTITNLTITNLYAETITNNTFVNTNVVILSGKATIKTLIVTNVAIYGSLTDAVATASSVAYWAADKTLGSVANGTGALTNNGAGAVDWYGSYADQLGNNVFTGTSNFFGTFVAIAQLARLANLSVTNFITNGTLTASTVLAADTNKRILSVANGTGALTNDGSGALGYYSLDTLLGRATNEVTRQINSGTNIYSSLGTAISDISTATNLSYAYKFRTDIGNGAVAFGQGMFTNISADTTLASMTYGGLGANGYETAIVAVTNSDTAVHKLTMPANVIGKPGKVAPGVFYITNGVISQIMISHMGALYTNACYDF